MRNQRPSSFGRGLAVFYQGVRQRNLFDQLGWVGRLAGSVVIERRQIRSVRVDVQVPLVFEQLLDRLRGILRYRLEGQGQVLGIAGAVDIDPHIHGYNCFVMDSHRLAGIVVHANEFVTVTTVIG
ncbi:hypothetical protein PFLmoz3_00110 [Pseudomonas fluorescens]|uniref:Uncharacterized protein n=1 Tax=Pseudomonas fluorescens TaxID=294 RepID=A0A109LLN6_PSEFL|nr:hypothetical protein PFLmoz3_00110 [Pseudomonas fluorescens]